MSQAVFVLLLLLVMIVAFASGKFNFGLISLSIPVVLQATGILTAAEAWTGFSNTGILLFIPLFMLGTVLKKSSFLFRLKKLVAKLGSTRGGHIKVLLVFAVSAVLLANFMNATAAIALLAPMIGALSSEDKRFSRRGVTKWCADIANASRQIFPFGLVLAEYAVTNAKLEAAGSPYRLRILDPILSKTPFVLIWLAFMVFFGYRFYNKWSTADPMEESMAKDSSASNGKEDRGTTLSPFMDKLAYFLFFGNVAAMLFGTMFTNIPILIWAFMFALTAVYVGIVTPRECIDNMSWVSLLLAAGTMPLTTAIVKSGAQEYIASAVGFFMRGNNSVFALSIVFYFFASITTQFMSDLASKEIYTSIALAATVGLGLDPRPVLMAVLIGAFASVLTPMANAGQAICYGSGGYKFIEYIKAGLIPYLVYTVLFIVYQPIYMNLILK